MKDRWNYCPQCGTNVNKRVSISSLLSRQMDIMRNLMTRDDYEVQRIRPVRNALTIRIDSRGFGQPHVQVFPKPIAAQQKEPYQERRTERKLTGEIIEPKVNVKRLAREMIMTIPLPGVKSGADIELNRLEDSVEVRAFAGDKGYFKILNIPKNHRLVEKSLTDGKLNLKFAI